MLSLSTTTASAMPVIKEEKEEGDEDEDEDEEGIVTMKLPDVDSSMFLMNSSGSSSSGDASSHALSSHTSTTAGALSTTSDAINSELDELKALANYTKSVALVLHDQVKSNNAHLSVTAENVDRTALKVENATKKAKDMAAA